MCVFLCVIVYVLECDCQCVRVFLCTSLCVRVCPCLFVGIRVCVCVRGCEYENNFIRTSKSRLKFGLKLFQKQ